MDVTQHDFMDCDSHIDCSRIRSFLTDEVIADLMYRPEWILGETSEACRQAIVAGVATSQTLSVAEVEKIREALTHRPAE